jgi:hypothetical protein
MGRYCSHTLFLPQTLSRVLLATMLLSMLSACSPKQKFSSFYKSSSGEELLIHRVNSLEESLRLISLWYTGSVFKETAIRQKNPQLGPTLKVGDFVAIPREILLQSEPLPLAFIESQRAELAKPKKTSKTTASSSSRKVIPAKRSRASSTSQTAPQQKAPQVKHSAGSVQQTADSQQPAKNVASPSQPATENTETAPSAVSKAEKKESETLEDQLLKNLLTNN